MTTKLIAVAAGVLLACSGGKGGGSASFDAEVDELAATTCELAATCFGQSSETCEADIRNDMADAKAQLDAAGEAACAECMNVKSREVQNILDAMCDIDAGSEQAVFDACDLDPAVDYDGDGTPDNDHDEACAGFP